MLFALFTLNCHASLTVLVGEPFGRFGAFLPVGHTAIYLDRVCADGPLKLRMCRNDEPHGVVIARYHRIGRIDWIATPIMQFLYATDKPEDIPAYATPRVVSEMRDRYRRNYLEAVVPDGTEKRKSIQEWWETAGVAYSRRLWAYQVNTTRAQDESFVSMMNSLPNHYRYHFRRSNCANFVADVVNFYFPGAVRRSDRVADFGLMTPKQVARSLAAYGAAHPEEDLRVLEIPQVPGSLPRSRPVRGGAEAGLKTKRYLVPLIAIQPEVPLALAVLYLDHGRWQVGKGAEIAQPAAFYLQPASSQPVSSQPAELLAVKQLRSGGGAQPVTRGIQLSAEPPSYPSN